MAGDTERLSNTSWATGGKRRERKGVRSEHKEGEATQVGAHNTSLFVSSVINTISLFVSVTREIAPEESWGGKPELLDVSSLQSIVLESVVGKMMHLGKKHVTVILLTGVGADAYWVLMKHSGTPVGLP